MTTHREHDGHEAMVRHWRTIRGHKYVVLASFSVGVLAAAAASYLTTPIYRATALVLVEDDTPRIVGMQGMYPSEAPEDRYCETQVKLIRSRSVLRAAAERLRLDGWEEFAGARDVVAALTGRVRVAQVPNTKLIQVSVDGPDKTKLDDIANAIVECFQEESIRRRKQSSEHATGWLEGQLPRLRAEVIEAEERLRQSQEENSIVSPDRSHGIVSQRLAQLNKDVTAAERERIAIEADYSLIEAAAGNAAKLSSLPVVVENATVRQLDVQILQLRSQEIDLLKNLTPAHPDVRSTEAKILSLEAERQKMIRAVLSATKNRLEAAKDREEALRAALAEQKKRALDLNEKLITLSALQRDVEHAKQLYEPLLERSGKLDLASGLNLVPVQIVDLAEEPLAPIKPRRTLFLAAGALLGLLVGLRLAFLLERSDTKVRAPEDIERASGLKALGQIPHMVAGENDELSVVCHSDPRSAAAEAYRGLRTSLLLSMSGNGSTVLLVTSAMAGEGKTTTATNIASAMAQAQKRVLLVDADMRRSSIHRAFGIEDQEGLYTYLTNGLGPTEAVRESKISGLYIVTAGGAPENPSELLGSPRLKEFLDWARRNFDVIVIDSPPLGNVTDASVLAPKADGVLQVIRANCTPKGAAAYGRELLDNAKANVLGAVLNDIRRPRGLYGYGYYPYGNYSYGGEPKE